MHRTVDRQTLLRSHRFVTCGLSLVCLFASAFGLAAAERTETPRAPVTKPSSEPAGGGTQADFTQLINLIESTVEPDSWQSTGGQGSMGQYNTGVFVNPHGLLRTLTPQQRSELNTLLARRRRVPELHDDLSRGSPLRFVSLVRLERALAERLENGRPVPEAMRRLAGLTKLQYLVADPEERDVLIAGPAEGWLYDEDGRPVGRESRRPLLDLDDLVVVLRAFAPGGDGRFGCSINTRDANLKSVKQFVEASNSAGPLRSGQLGKWLKELHARLGLQDIVVHGVPADSHVARVLVEADYKMKLIGVDKYDGGPDIPSYFDLLRRSRQYAGAPLEALRWWLTMKYDAIATNSEHTAFEFVGQSVQVQSENQFVNAQGQHVPTGAAEPLNRAFAANFTRHYAALAMREPVFGDLSNVFDMALAAALLRQHALHERTGWNLTAFAPGGAYEAAIVVAPRVVESVINHRVYGGKDIVVQVAGGVQADVVAIARDSQRVRETAAFDAPIRHPARGAVPPDRWWWDVTR